MRLVEDHRRSLGQNARIGRAGRFLLHREVGKKQVVVHDDDVDSCARRRISVMKQRR